jgi:hypothetical protein
MPVNLQLAVFMLGAILLLIAILGGGFKIFGAEINQTDNLPARGIAGFLGLTMVLAALLLPNPAAAPPAIEPPPYMPPQTVYVPPPKAPGDVIIGVWKQYVQAPESTQWQYVGTFDVAKSNGNYTMSAREQRESPEVVNSIGIFDVQSDGQTWRFNSNWGGGAVGNFTLQRISDTVFEGAASIENQPRNPNKWVRIQ